jgi:hypothetical protein
LGVRVNNSILYKPVSLVKVMVCPSFCEIVAKSRRLDTIDSQGDPLEGSIRGRAIARNSAKSSSPIANSIVRRNPAMTRKPRFRIKAASLQATSGKMSPAHTIGSWNR